MNVKFRSNLHRGDRCTAEIALRNTNQKEEATEEDSETTPSNHLIFNQISYENSENLSFLI